MHHRTKGESLTKKNIMLKTPSFIALILSISVSSTKAQFEIGQKLLGGNIGFSTVETNNSSNYTTNTIGFGISPTYSIFKKPNQLVGLGLSYNYSQQKSSTIIGTNESTNNSNSIGIDAFTQKFFPLSSKFFFTLKGNTGFGYVFGKQYNYNGTDKLEEKSKGYNVGLNFAPGISYVITPRILCDAALSSVLSLQYAHRKTTNTNIGNDFTTTQNTFYINSALNNTLLSNINIGFRWLLKK